MSKFKKPVSGSAPEYNLTPVNSTMTCATRARASISLPGDRVLPFWSGAPLNSDFINFDLIKPLQQDQYNIFRTCHGHSGHFLALWNGLVCTLWVPLRCTKFENVHRAPVQQRCCLLWGVHLSVTKFKKLHLVYTIFCIRYSGKRSNLITPHTLTHFSGPRVLLLTYAQ